MARTKKSPKAIEDEMKALREELKSAKEAEELAFGRMARKAGLLDLDIPQKEMVEALENLRSRFQGSSQTGNSVAGGQASIQAEQTGQAT